MDPLVIGAIILLALLLVGGGLLAWQRRGAPAAEIGTSAGAPPSPRLADRFFEGLARTREGLARSLGLALESRGPLDERLERLEEALIGADVGVRTAAALVAAIRQRASAQASADELRALLRDELLRAIGPAVGLNPPPPSGPMVILVVGVNGSGKTTTIGKLAHRFKGAGLSVLLAAGDTFRAGAIEQLKVWGERAGVPVVAHQEGADPAAVVFDGVKAAQARGVDVVICDTAGRLQAQKLLMDELAKVSRVLKKAEPSAPHEALLVLDATIGQNALLQAREFQQVVGLTGVVLTKLDGTARGGVVVAVQRELGLPVKLVGLGERADDLRDFDPVAFVDGLLGESG